MYDFLPNFFRNSPVYKLRNDRSGFWFVLPTTWSQYHWFCEPCDVSSQVSFDSSGIPLKIRLDLIDRFLKSSSSRSTPRSWVSILLMWRSSLTCVVTLFDRSSFVSCCLSRTSFIMISFFLARSRASFACISTLHAYSSYRFFVVCRDSVLKKFYIIICCSFSSLNCAA